MIIIARKTLYNDFFKSDFTSPLRGYYKLFLLANKSLPPLNFIRFHGGERRLYGIK